MMAIDNNLRLSYLKEMGITVWKQRFPDSERVNFASNSPQEEKDSEDVPILTEELPTPQTMTDTWEHLLDEINHCSNCHLCQSRNKIVPGVGDPKADWLFVGEGPGYFEDQQGEPFVGRSGKLLDNMMARMFLKRGENVYIANIVKCRASNAGKDRQPTEAECAICMPFLERQIALINPKIIVALGKTAATALLNISREASLSSMRKKEHYYSNGSQKIPLVVTYHPSYLLRTPLGKRQAWEDLCQAMEIFETIESQA